MAAISKACARPRSLISARSPRVSRSRKPHSWWRFRNRPSISGPTATTRPRRLGATKCLRALPSAVSCLCSAAQEAMAEPVPAARSALPFSAPHLAERVAARRAGGRGRCARPSTARSNRRWKSSPRARPSRSTTGPISPSSWSRTRRAPCAPKSPTRITGAPSAISI